MLTLAFSSLLMIGASSLISKVDDIKEHSAVDRLIALIFQNVFLHFFFDFYVPDIKSICFRNLLEFQIRINF